MNPGNLTWQFCLVTPSGTYNRDHLQQAGFSYSGPVSSLFLLPTAGGGDVTVNGLQYTLRSGQYYRFDGRPQVSVSTTHPGAMGHWSVCVDDRTPETGSGNKRPKSPCEIESGNINQGKKKNR